MDVSGLGALITGGGSGLGAEAARALTRAGAKVTVLDINLEAAEKVAAEIGGIAVKADVRSEEEAEAAVKAAADAHGPTRITINCAGLGRGGRVAGKDGPMPLENFKFVVDVNLIGSFNLLRLTAYEMAKLDPVNDDGERGVVINTASIAAYEGQIGQASYSAAKAGIIGMTLPIARELAQFGIRVCTIAPGLIDTPLFGGLPQTAYDSLVASTLFPKRLGRPEEYAKMAMAIIDNPLLNGETIRLDGALRMSPR